MGGNSAQLGLALNENCLRAEDQHGPTIVRSIIVNQQAAEPKPGAACH